MNLLVFIEGNANCLSTDVNVVDDIGKRRSFWQVRSD